MLGTQYAGVLQRDGWAPYRQFTQAAHQTCLAHLLRRCRTMMLDIRIIPLPHRSISSCAPRSPRTTSIGPGTSPTGGLAVARGHYLTRLGRLLAARRSRLATARRFAAHLRAEYDAVFSFLFDPTLDATNWRAEHALRPAVLTRKTCGGGNRTTRGA